MTFEYGAVSFIRREKELVPSLDDGLGEDDFVTADAKIGDLDYSQDGNDAVTAEASGNGYWNLGDIEETTVLNGSTTYLTGINIVTDRKIDVLDEDGGM